MTYREAEEVFVADTLNSFLDQMCVSSIKALNALPSSELRDIIIDLYNDDVESQADVETVESINELPESSVDALLQETLGGHNRGFFRDYLATRDGTYTIVTTPSGWEKVIKITDE